MAKKSFFNNFFEIEEKDPLEKVSKALESQPHTVSLHTQVVEKAVTTPQPLVTTPLMSGGYTGKFDGTFEAIIEKENLPGPDVYELIMSVQEMQSSGVTEEQAYRNAYTAFKSMGLTKEKLVETTNFYIGVIAKVYNDFQTNVIGAKQKEIMSIDSQRANLVKEIEERTLKLNELATQRQTLNDEVTSVTHEIDGSYGKMDTFLKSVIFKIQTYL